MKNLSVLVPDGEFHFALGFLRCLGYHPRVKIHVVSNRLRPSIKHSRYCTSFHYIPSPGKDEKWLEKILDLGRKYQVDLIFPLGEQTIEFFILHKEKVNRVIPMIPLPGLKSFQTAVDKGTLAAFCLDNGIDCPETLFFQSGKVDENLLDRQLYPQVLKVRRGEGGKGIFKINSPEHFRQTAEKNTLPLDQYILQDFISGFDIHCSVLCREGRILSYIIWRELEASDPSKRNFKSKLNVLQFIHDPQVLAIVEKLMKELNWNGLANLNLRFDEKDGKIKMIELNARIWASLLGSLSGGINFPYLTCQLALEGTIPASSYREGYFFNSKTNKNGIPFSWKHSFRKYAFIDPAPQIVSKIHSILPAFFQKEAD